MSQTLNTATMTNLVRELNGNHCVLFPVLKFVSPTYVTVVLLFCPFFMRKHHTKDVTDTGFHGKDEVSFLNDVKAC